MPPTFMKTVVSKEWSYRPPGWYSTPPEVPPDPANLNIHWVVPQFVDAITMYVRGGGGGVPISHRTNPTRVDTGAFAWEAHWQGISVSPGDVIDGLVGETVWDTDPFTPGYPGGGSGGGVGLTTGYAGGGYTEVRRNGNLLCIAGGAGGFGSSTPWGTASGERSVFNHGDPEPGPGDLPRYRVAYNVAYPGEVGGVRSGGDGLFKEGYGSSGGGGGYGGGAGSGLHFEDANEPVPGEYKSSLSTNGGYLRPPFNPAHPDTPKPRANDSEWHGAGDGVGRVVIYWHHYRPYVEILGPTDLRLGRRYRWNVGESQSRYGIPLTYRWKIWDTPTPSHHFGEEYHVHNPAVADFGNVEEIEWRPTYLSPSHQAFTVGLEATDHENQVVRAVKNFWVGEATRWSVGPIGWG